MIILPAYSSSDEREPTPAERAALHWVVRCASGLAPEHEREFRAWLGAALEHRALFAEFSTVWAVLDRHPAAPAASAERVEICSATEGATT